MQVNSVLALEQSIASSADRLSVIPAVPIREIVNFAIKIDFGPWRKS